jgi:uncharacterized integral membrane protein
MTAFMSFLGSTYGPLIVTLIIMALIGLIGPLFVGGSRVPSQTRQH